MENLLCFALVALFIAFGEFISTRTKASIPSIFASACCFLVAFWTFAPKDLVAKASFGPAYINIAISLLLVHLGTLMNLRKLFEQWRSVSISLLGVAGTLTIALTLGRSLFDHATVIAVTPPMVGGVVAALLMTNALTAKGLTALVAMPVAMFVLHGFAGYPITSWCLRREGRRLLAMTPEKTSAASSAEAPPPARKKLLPPVPEAYLSPALILSKVTLIALLAAWIAGVSGGKLNQHVVCLVLGVIFCEAGFLEEQALGKAGMFNWLIFGLMAFIFAQLANTTPESLAGIFATIATLLALGILGMFVVSWIASPFFGLSREMGFACALTALFGFPADYVITEEVCRSLGKTDAEYQRLMDHMMPKMLVGGFATVSIASVVIAGFFVNLL